MIPPPFSSFMQVPYPSFFLAQDGTLHCNEAAHSAEPPFCDAEAMKRLLQAAQRQQHSEGNTSTLPLLTDALGMRTLSLVPLPEGLLAVAQEKKQAPVGAFSSQLRDSLTNILSSLSFLAARMDGEEEHFVHSIQMNSYQLLRLATNLENAARLENKSFGLQVIDLSVFVDDIMQQASAACRHLRIPITWSVPERPLPVKVDVSLLTSALLNLLRNSLQFTRDSNSIHVALRALKGRVLLSVEDKGLGILETNLPHVFEPYFSADPYGDSGERPGVGLGLSAVRETVTCFGGTITVESRFGEGTQFHMSLPLHQGSTSDELLESASTGYATRGNAVSLLNIHLCGYGMPPSHL